MSTQRNFLGVALLVPAMVLAQEPSPADELLDLSLESLLQVNVATAGWRATSLHEASASVTIFRREDLERMGLRHLHEVLNYVPGAYSARVASTGYEQRSVLRGNSGTTGGGLLVIDGQPVNSMYNVRPWGVVRNFPISMVERVEVLRGPGGARFGGGPSDEVIHVVTRQGVSAVEARWGAGGSAAAQALWHAKAGEWQVQVRVADAQEDRPRRLGVFERFGKPTPLDEKTQEETVSFDVAWRNHRVSAHQHVSDMTGYYSLNGNLSDDDAAVTDAAWLRYEGSAQSTELAWRWHVGLLEQRFVQEGTQLPRGVGPFQQDDLRLRGVLRHTVKSAGLSVQDDIGLHSLTTGIELKEGRVDRAELQSNFLQRPPFTYYGAYRPTGLDFAPVGATERVFAVFGEDRWQLSETQSVVLGLRHDRYDLSGNATTPRAAWVWTPSQRRSLKLLYQEAFFAPSLGQLFLQNNPVIAGAPDLTATRVRTFEAVGSAQSDTVYASATLYRRHAKDGFALVAAPGGTGTTTVNATTQFTTGIETSLQWRPNRHWQFTLNAASILSDQYTLPASLAEAPPASFRSRDVVSALLTWQKGHWQATLGSTWRSQEAFQTDGRTDMVMAHLNYDMGAWRLFAHADNLLNATVYDVDVGEGIGRDARGQVVRTMPLPGRELWLGAEYRWR